MFTPSDTSCLLPSPNLDADAAMDPPSPPSFHPFSNLDAPRLPFVPPSRTAALSRASVATRARIAGKRIFHSILPVPRDATRAHSGLSAPGLSSAVPPGGGGGPRVCPLALLVRTLQLNRAAEGERRAASATQAANAARHRKLALATAHAQAQAQAAAAQVNLRRQGITLNVQPSEGSGEAAAAVAPPPLPVPPAPATPAMNTAAAAQAEQGIEAVLGSEAPAPQTPLNAAPSGTSGASPSSLALNLLRKRRPVLRPLAGAANSVSQAALNAAAAAASAASAAAAAAAASSALHAPLTPAPAAATSSHSQRPPLSMRTQQLIAAPLQSRKRGREGPTTALGAPMSFQTASSSYAHAAAASAASSSKRPRTGHSPASSYRVQSPPPQLMDESVEGVGGVAETSANEESEPEFVPVRLAPIAAAPSSSSSGAEAEPGFVNVSSPPPNVPSSTQRAVRHPPPSPTPSASSHSSSQVSRPPSVMSSGAYRSLTPALSQPPPSSRSGMLGGAASAMGMGAGAGSRSFGAFAPAALLPSAHLRLGPHATPGSLLTAARAAAQRAEFTAAHPNLVLRQQQQQHLAMLRHGAPATPLTPHPSIEAAAAAVASGHVPEEHVSRYQRGMRYMQRAREEEQRRRDAASSSNAQFAHQHAAHADAMRFLSITPEPAPAPAPVSHEECKIGESEEQQPAAVHSPVQQFLNSSLAAPSSSAALFTPPRSSPGASGAPSSASSSVAAAARAPHVPSKRKTRPTPLISMSQLAQARTQGQGQGQRDENKEEDATRANKLQRVSSASSPSLSPFPQPHSQSQSQELTQPLSESQPLDGSAGSQEEEASTQQQPAVDAQPLVNPSSPPVTRSQRAKPRYKTSSIATLQ